MKPQLYFKRHEQWYEWLDKNHTNTEGVYLIFYKVDHENESMRWEEAVKVALCFGWIDSTVKSLGAGKRQQYFCPRKDKSVWSAVNKNYIESLISEGLMHEKGYKSIEVAMENGSWTSLDEVEKGIIPDDLQAAFNKNELAYSNYLNFAPSYKKSYLYWLNQAKKEETRQKRIAEIINLCKENRKGR